MYEKKFLFVNLNIKSTAYYPHLALSILNSNRRPVNSHCKICIFDLLILLSYES